MLAFNSLDYLKDDELVFGVSADRTVDISYRLGLQLPISDIENPWLLMFMYLGALVSIWLLAMFCVNLRLARGAPLPLKMAIIVYFLIASTSNSFGRKDNVYTIMTAAGI